MPGARTGGVISGSNQGSRRAPRFPGGLCRRASENPDQSSPYSSRMRSRAREPFLKQVSPIYAPVGEQNTCPVPAGSTNGLPMNPNTVSLVPIEMATRPSRTRPAPTRLDGLSPDHEMIFGGEEAEKPYLRTQYGDRFPATCHDSRMIGSLSSRPAAVDRS